MEKFSIADFQKAKQQQVHASIDMFYETCNLRHVSPLQNHESYQSNNNSQCLQYHKQYITCPLASNNDAWTSIVYLKAGISVYVHEPNYANFQILGHADLNFLQLFLINCDHLEVIGSTYTLFFKYFFLQVYASANIIQLCDFGHEMSLSSQVIRILLQPFHPQV